MKCWTLVCHKYVICNHLVRPPSPHVICNNLGRPPNPWLHNIWTTPNLDLSVTKKRRYPVFVRPGNSSIFWCLIVLEWRPPGLICLQRRKRRPVRHNPTSDPHPMSSACPTWLLCNGGNLAQKTIPKQSHKKPKLFGLLQHYLKTDMNINTMVW